MFSSSPTEALHPLNTDSPFLVPSDPGNHCSTFSPCWSDSCRELMQVESCSLCAFARDLFSLATCLQGSLVSWHVSECSSFLRLDRITLYTLPHLVLRFIHRWTRTFGELCPLALVDKRAMWRHRDKRGVLCDNRGRVWRYPAEIGKPRDAKDFQQNHQELERSKEGFHPRFQRKRGPAATLILDFSPLHLWGKKFLVF